MLTFVTLVVLGVLLGMVLMQLFGKHTPPPPGPDLANLKVTDARAGDALSISGAGDNYADLDFTVDRVTRFEAGARRWFELSGPYRERRAAVRVAGDDEVEIGLHDGARKLTIEEVGLAEQDLAEIDERQNTGDSFEFDGKVWFYRLSREIQSKRDDQAAPVGYYYWEFATQDGKAVIAVRKGEGEPFAVTLYSVIALADVNVYRAGNAPR